MGSTNDGKCATSDLATHVIAPGTPPPPRKLSVKQLQAIPMLVRGMTSTDVARELGVSTSTVSNWMTDNEEFRAELDKQRCLIYELDLQAARSALRTHVASPEAKVSVAASKVIVDADVGYQRAHGTVTHTVILDKLARALGGANDAAIDAEYRELAAQSGRPMLADGETPPGATPGGASESDAASS